MTRCEMRTHSITQNTDKKVSACEVDYINIILKNKSIHMSDCTLFTTGILQNKRIENIQINNKGNAFFASLWPK